MQRVLLTFSVLVLLGLGGPSLAGAQDIAVIVNRSNSLAALSMVALRKIVLGQESRWPGGGKILVWMTRPGQVERARTLKVVAGMTETDYTLHFMHASFNGDSGEPPKTAASGALVRRAVAGSTTGVGFILASQVDESVKVLAIDGSRPGQPAYKLTLK